MNKYTKQQLQKFTHADLTKMYMKLQREVNKALLQAEYDVRAKDYQIKIWEDKYIEQNGQLAELQNRFRNVVSMHNRALDLLKAHLHEVKH